LFPTPDSSELQRLLPKDAARPANVGTVRIYARSLRLTKSPLAQESVHPSVITVERAALCQIFLETKYHKTFQQPSERDVRRQTLETLVSNGKELTTEQKFKFNEILKSVESEWSRLSRVRPSIDAFTIERKLGSGGFGVVNMVTEKKTGQVYAMKV
jgi:protein-serine/threonine kinase